MADSFAHRTTLIEALSASMRAAVEAGDLAAARIAHQALGDLLGSETQGAAPVIDLADERGKRGR